MALDHGAYQEGKAGGLLIGASARNPYREAAMRDDWSNYVHCASDWESGKVIGLTMRRTEASK